jgi:hypothetical protein
MRSDLGWAPPEISSEIRLGVKGGKWVIQIALWDCRAKTRKGKKQTQDVLMTSLPGGTNGIPSTLVILGDHIELPSQVSNLGGQRAGFTHNSFPLISEWFPHAATPSISAGHTCSG